MDTRDLQKLPLGRSTFSTLRKRNCIYVDKTDMVFRLTSDDAKIFLARPRRFGKSLLVSTFKSLFRHGLRDFGGLLIEKLWNDRTYTVLHLDFSIIKDFQSFEEFLELFDEMLTEAAEDAAIFMPEASNPVQRFRSFISKQDDSTLVLLIDEYDAPMTAQLENPELFAQVRTCLSRFYSALKAHEGCLRFFFMTGITKFSNTSIFSAFNNLEDVSLYPDYGTLLGYTDEEIQKYFEPYLDKAARALNTQPMEILRQLRNNYDGFSFDENASTHVYCPWSILNFFKIPERGFQNYWYESGGKPAVLMGYLTNHALADPISYNQPILMNIEDLNASRQYDEMSIESLLTQTGYLTIKEARGGGVVRLGYPNREVAVSMARLYAKRVFKRKSLLAAGASFLAKEMEEASPDTVVDHFNEVLNAVDYQRYPITDEASCRAYLQVLLIGASLLPSVENHSALGRSDLEVTAGSRRWVFEIKYAKPGDNARSLLETALAQIRTRRYGESPRQKELIRIGMVFCGEERRFTDWKCLDETEGGR